MPEHEALFPNVDSGELGSVAWVLNRVGRWRVPAVAIALVEGAAESRAAEDRPLLARRILESLGGCAAADSGAGR
jgi:hypothetical protein